MSPKRPPSIMGDDERARAGHERRSKPMHAVPEPIDEEPVTGVLTGADLKAERAKRPTEKRIEHVEDGLDNLRGEVSERFGKLENTVANMSGQLQILPQLTQTMQGAIATMWQKDALAAAAKHANDNAQQLEKADKKKNTRARLTALWVTLVGSLGAIIHWIAGKL